MKRTFLRRVGDLLLYGFVSGLVVIVIAVALSGPSQKERRTTAANVARLVEESQKNRQILCLTIVRGAEDPGSLDPDLVELCGEVGVSPVEGEPMLAPFPWVPKASPGPEPSPTVPPVPTPSPIPSVAPGPSQSPVPSPSGLPSLPTPTCIPLVCEEE